MSTVLQKPLLIAAIGMDNKTREVLRMSFQGPGKNCCFLVEENTSEAIIFNMDSPNAMELWTTYRNEYPNKPTIVMALKKPDIENINFVGKPVRIEQLIAEINTIKKDIEALKEEAEGMDIILETTTPDNVNTVTRSDKIEEPSVSAVSFQKLPELDHEFCGSNPDIDLSNTDKHKNIFYHTYDFLQARLQWAAESAKKEGVALQISIKVGNDWKVIIFLPKSGRVINSLSDFQLRVVCTAPKYCTTVKIRLYTSMDSNNLEERANHHGSTENFDSFMWKIALWTARGRLPSGTSLTTPVKLKHWPNLTRVQNIPNIMRIATLLGDQPRPLPLVAKVLNIPQRHVFSFYTAMHSIKLAEPVNSCQVDSSNIPVTKNKQRSLFGRILKRLTGKN
ncbi:hypothetical protein MNBD_GAMMA16-1660 [hydrothermal vent metagenome]|uniref:Uncharacterized protein n=1 Tax=hydrothermal vent metagenome TaxID=652676 RepID=A0A3B0ZD44_9ZZZZ